MPTLIRPPDNTDVTSYMRLLFLRAERDIINEIKAQACIWLCGLC